jgi:hypothetical protein
MTGRRAKNIGNVADRSQQFSRLGRAAPPDAHRLPG